MVDENILWNSEVREEAPEKQRWTDSFESSHSDTLTQYVCSLSASISRLVVAQKHPPHAPQHQHYSEVLETEMLLMEGKDTSVSLLLLGHSKLLLG